jgi:hypothetical protein
MLRPQPNICELDTKHSRKGQNRVVVDARAGPHIGLGVQFDSAAQSQVLQALFLKNIYRERVLIVVHQICKITSCPVEFLFMPPDS